MRILITGASGFIGSHLVTALRRDGHEVRAYVRDPRRFRQGGQGITTVKGDFSADHSTDDWLPRLKQVDVVINAVGIIRESRGQPFDALHTRAPIALFRACEAAGIKRVIQISALGADASAVSRYHQSKLAADNTLRGLDLDWAVLLPSIVYGPGAKSMTLFRALAALPLIPLVSRGEQAIQPIHIDDLTRAVRRLVASPTPLRADIEMVGPTPVQMRDLLSKLRAWLGLGPARFVSIPYPLARQATRLVGLMGDSPVGPETLQMLRDGSTAAVAPFAERFGFSPRSLDQALAAAPATQADQWHAGLYPLRPLLRLSIAFVWLFTGIVSAFIYPVEQSYALLARAGIEGIWQPVMLYGAAATNLLLGMATLTAFRLRQVAWLQIGIILMYSTIISVWLPEHWAHPFGPLSKNLPLIMATLAMLVLERR